MKYLITLVTLSFVISACLADSPLQVTAERRDAASYRVRIANVSTNDVVFRIGTNVGNGRYIFYDAIALVLRDLDGKEHKIESNWDNLPGIAGRVDPLYLALTPGASLVVDVNAAGWRLDSPAVNHSTSFKVSLDTKQDRADKVPIEYVNGHVLMDVYESPEYSLSSQQPPAGDVLKAAPEE